MQNVRQVGVRPAGTAAGQQLQGYQGIPILGPGGAVQFGIPVQPATAVRPQVKICKHVFFSNFESVYILLLEHCVRIQESIFVFQERTCYSFIWSQYMVMLYRIPFKHIAIYKFVIYFR